MQIADTCVAGKPPVECVYHHGSDECRVSECQPFAMVGYRRRKWCSRQERLLWIFEIMQCATPEQGVLAGRVEVEVNPCNERVIIDADRGPEPEPRVVQAVAHARVVSWIFPVAECLVNIAAMSA